MVIMDDSGVLCQPYSLPKHMLLNRSASFSEMSSRKKVVMEERLLSSPGQTLFRRYSCEQISFSPSSGMVKVGIIRQFASEIYLPFNSSNAFNFSDLKTSIDEVSAMKQDNSKNTLDVALLPNTHKDDTDKVDTDKDDTDKDHTDKKIHPYESVHMYKRSMKWCLWLFIPLLCVCLGMFATQSVLYQKTCQIVFNIHELQKSLNDKVFGQENAVAMIVSVLQTFYSTTTPGVQVLVITGTTGVGKSYAVSLLKEQFPWQENIHHWIMPINAAELAYYSYDKFSSCGDNLIIVDSLSQQDTDDVVKFAQFLTVSNTHNRVFVIFIFSINNQFSVDSSKTYLDLKNTEVQVKFYNAGINFNFIPFQSLEEQHVVMCIKASMVQKGISLSKNRLDFVLKNIFPEEGCKRVASKVTLLNVDRNH